MPKTFKKTQPRFLGQLFDTYAQGANNRQVWNEELSATRRYVILRIEDADRISRVKVVNGEELAKLDATGTLTQKYQARLNLDLSRFCSGQVLMLSGPSFEGHGAFPGQC